MEKTVSDLLPVIYLAFSNDQDAYLESLKEEAKTLFDILYPLQESRQYEVFREENVALDDLFTGFRRFRKRIQIFHYGGHADGGHLRLEGNEIYSHGLKALFDTLDSEVKLVFLNGCSTKSQVEELLDSGIPAVIGTKAKIEDKAAVEFSQQFYQELVSGSTLKSAFDVASAYLLAKAEHMERPTVVFRDYTQEWDQITQEKEELPWGLFIAKEQEGMLNWRLVEKERSRSIDYDSLKSVSFEDPTQQQNSQTYQINQYLLSPLGNAIQKWDQDFELNPAEQEHGLLDSGAFPRPILSPLERLLVEQGPMMEFSLDRLRQLVFTYHESTRFLAYTFLEQLIQTINRIDAHLSDSNVILTRFLSMTDTQNRTLDFLQLANEIDKIFRDHELDPWLREGLDVLKAFEEQKELRTIHVFMQKLLPLTLPETPDMPEELDLLCQQAEYCLGKLLEQMTFFIRYHLIAIDHDPESSTPRGLDLLDPSEFVSLPGLDKEVQGSIRLVRNNPQTIFTTDPALSLDMSYLLGVSIEEKAPPRLAILEYQSHTGSLHYRISEVRSENPPARRSIDGKESNGENGAFSLGEEIILEASHPSFIDFRPLLELTVVLQPPKRFRYANYNADAPDGEDHLDIMPDVRAFANLIASTDLAPPLSIGLFGDWGSGKSFFMGKLREEVKRYEDRAKQDVERASKSFLEQLKSVSDPSQRIRKILQLFPEADPQIPQLQTWIKRWKDHKDNSALRNLSGVFAHEEGNVIKTIREGILKSHSAAEVKKVLQGRQEIVASQLVTQLVEQKPTPAALDLLQELIEWNGRKERGFCRNIAQIEFNAWHYIDSNLWASLITNILEDLSTYVGNQSNEEKIELQLYRELATTQLMREEVQREIEVKEKESEEIQEELTRLQKEKAEVERKLTNVTFTDALSLLLNQEEGVSETETTSDDGPGPKESKNLMVARKGEKGVSEQEGTGTESMLEREASTLVREIESRGTKILQDLGISSPQADDQSSEQLQTFKLNARHATEQLQALEVDVKTSWSRWTAWKKVFQEMSPKSKWILLALFVVPLLAIGSLLKLFGSLGWLIPLAAFFSDGLVVVRKLWNNITTAVDRLDQAHTRLDQLKLIASKAQQDQIAELQLQLEVNRTKLNSKQAEEATYRMQIAKLKASINEIERGKRLSAFIEKRLLSNDYQQHLGVISLIREDFEKLSTYLQTQSFYAKVANRMYELNQASKGSEDIESPDPFDRRKINSIDRIVLYVDDLDRCPPDKVVQVLQAIHLILAFPLFVVVVGVDVRWISRSIIKEYGTMLAQPHKLSQPQAVGHLKEQSEFSLHFQSNATPFDYLEKIFQLPFQLNKMSNASKEFFMGKLLETDMKQAKSSGLQKPNKEAQSSASDKKETAEIVVPGAKPAKETSKTILQTKTSSPPSENPKKKAEGKQTVSQASSPVFRDPASTPKSQKLERVFLKVREIQFIKAMAPILSNSPRTVKRFVNVCRLIKSHAIWGRPQRILDGKISEYETMIFILALVTGIPAFTRFLFDELEARLEKESTNARKTSISDGKTFSFEDLLKELKQKLEDQDRLSQILQNRHYLEQEDFMEEWESFQKLWGEDETHSGLIPEEDEVNHQLIEDFSQKPLQSLKPLFQTAVRFSFRFTEY